jgi:hypothetical protein
MGAKRTHEMKNLLTWQCHIGATMASHQEMVGHDGYASVAESVVLKTVK